MKYITFLFFVFGFSNKLKCQIYSSSPGGLCHFNIDAPRKIALPDSLKDDKNKMVMFYYTAVFDSLGHLDTIRPYELSVWTNGDSDFRNFFFSLGNSHFNTISDSDRVMKFVNAAMLQLSQRLIVKRIVSPCKIALTNQNTYNDEVRLE